MVLVGNPESSVTNHEMVKHLGQWKKTVAYHRSPIWRTSFVHILSTECNYDLIEMNASDSRTRDMLESRILPGI